MRRFTTVLMIAIMAVAALACQAAAEPVAKPDSLSRSLLGFFTEMAGMSAPSWLMPGLRVVYKISNEDYVNPENGSIGYLIYDVVDVKGGYIASTMGTSHDTNGKPTGLMFGSVLMDAPTVGRFWITPELFDEARVAKERYALFYNTKVRIQGEEYDAMFIAFESQTASRTAAYDKESGLLLAIEMTVTDAEGKPKEASTIEFLGTRLSFPSWYEENLTGLSTGTALSYKAVYRMAGTSEEQAMDLKVLENNGTWALIERTSISSKGERSSFQLLSSSASGDVYVLWLPIGLLEAMEEGDIAFEEDLTGSSVKVMGVAEDPEFGAVRKLLFIDNAVHTECAFSLKTGYMVRMHQLPIAEGIPEVEFTLSSVK